MGEPIIPVPHLITLNILERARTSIDNLADVTNPRTGGLYNYSNRDTIHRRAASLAKELAALLAEIDRRARPAAAAREGER
jgi:hypothetical protein